MSHTWTVPQNNVHFKKDTFLSYWVIQIVIKLDPDTNGWYPPCHEAVGNLGPPHSQFKHVFKREQTNKQRTHSDCKPTELACSSIRFLLQTNRANSVKLHLFQRLFFFKLNHTKK